MVGRNISEVILKMFLNEMKKNREYIDNEACVEKMICVSHAMSCLLPKALKICTKSRGKSIL